MLWVSEIIAKLLGSTSKAEVLEAIEFFKIAREYELDGAETGIKKMIHLIWTKDNSSSTVSADDEGKDLKGIRQRLLESYGAIYFDPVPDLEPKKQVGRITRNMIESVVSHLQFSH